ncbi:hypothetical protein ZWY2020_033756 [Hordeum vulgare]|nr:hypothetical protein ZWY2020_033756 [Hordeum vulgare]
MGQRGATGLPDDPWVRPGPRSRQEAAWVGPTYSGALLQPILTPARENPSITSRIANFSIVPLPQRFRHQERQETSSQHPARGRIDLRELLHLHGCFPDVS